ncbi:NADP-dependent oxidoreductase domain-containing protein [Phyllosticta citrichinensis]|uniref:NADP-dependent oxidoreductase domain-containing protein n=1 Tax=Phyllosticta citrichinensis TaxID=1130410 RepID=A0ABR1XP41_9PEZI
MAFAPAPTPKSALGYHRILSPNAGIRVSPLCLGAMNFGDAWSDFMGKCDKKATYEILDYFFEQGGTFIDTANNYQSEESEKWIGDWMEERGIRDQIVLATKFTTNYRQGGPEHIKSNFQGNHNKSLRLSVEASLKKLKTDYIDLLYLHWWDFSTSIPELMQNLDALVKSGKILYLGISDTPAWIVSKANQYARDHALTPFSVYQGRWSAADRDFERDILPMCQDEGMALAPWGALGGGNFKTEEQLKAVQDGTTEGRKMWGPSESQRAISRVLEKIAARKQPGTHLTGIALAYVMHKAPYVFPIVGIRKKEHLEGNIAALRIELTPEEIREIEDAVEFDVGFPYSMLFEMFGQQKFRTEMSTGDIGLVKAAGHIDTVPKPQPIKPRQA